MKQRIIGRACAIGALALVSLVAFPVGRASAQTAAAAANGAKAGASANAQTASKLGDLSQFRAIVADVSALVGKGDLAAAKTRIKDLESLWDKNETKLKPKAAADWHALDRAIDKALHDLRQGKPSQAVCQGSVGALLKLFDQMSGTP
jgi:hypothetical protein